MSTLACIFVKKCDGCSAIVVLKNDIEWQTFQGLWHEGFDVDFCILCRDRDDVKRRIDSDELKRLEIIERIQDLGGNPTGSEGASSPTNKKEKAEYAH